MMIKLVIKGDPYPMTKPKAKLVWRPGQEQRPFVSWEWPAAYLEWKEAVRAEAKKVMQHRPRLLSGTLSLEAIFTWKRPKDHYTAHGVIKEHHLFTSPCQWPLNHELLRGAIDSVLNVVIADVKDLAGGIKSTKVWGPTGGAEIVIRNVDPRDIDPKLQALPKQGELGL